MDMEVVRIQMFVFVIMALVVVKKKLFNLLKYSNLIYFFFKLKESCEIPFIGNQIKERSQTSADDDWKRSFLDTSLYFPENGRIKEWIIHG